MTDDELENQHVEISRKALLGEKRRDRRHRLQVLAVWAGTLAACGLMALLLVLLVSGGSGGGFKVPDVLGKTYEQAQKKVEGSGLVIEVDPFQDSSSEDELGRLKVREQDPKPGSLAEKGELVTVRLTGLRDARVESGKPVQGSADSEASSPGAGQTGQPEGQHQPDQTAQSTAQTTGQPAQAAAAQPAPKTGSAHTVCLDPGHSGGSPGSEMDPASGLDVADNGGADGELQAMWDLAVKTKARLEQAGNRVVLTKESADSYASLRRRADVGNSCSIVIRLHFDPALHAVLFPGEGQYKEHGGTRVMVDPSVAASSRILAGALFPYMQGVGVSRLMNDAGGTSNNAGPAYVGSVLSRVPVVLIENDPAMVSGNLSGQDQVADAIARGVGAYFQGR